MSFSQIASKASTHFRDRIEIPLGLSVQYDNQKFVHPPDSIWATCDVSFHDTDQSSLGYVGNRVYRVYGYLSSRIFSPIERGDGELLDIASEILNKFAGITIDGITYRTATISGPGSRTPDEKWWQITVVCPWFTDIRV